MCALERLCWMLDCCVAKVYLCKLLAWYWKVTLILIPNILVPEINIATENEPFINAALGQFLGEREKEKVHIDTKQTKTTFVILGKISHLDSQTNSYFFSNDYLKVVR